MLLSRHRINLLTDQQLFLTCKWRSGRVAGAPALIRRLQPHSTNFPARRCCCPEWANRAALPWGKECNCLVLSGPLLGDQYASTCLLQHAGLQCRRTAYILEVDGLVHVQYRYIASSMGPSHAAMYIQFFQVRTSEQVVDELQYCLLPLWLCLYCWNRRCLDSKSFLTRLYLYPIKLSAGRSKLLDREPCYTHDSWTQDTPGTIRN